MSSFMFYDSSDDEDTEDLNLRRCIIDKCNLFELPTPLFIKYFRVSKEAFKVLLDEMEKNMAVVTRSSSVPPIIKLAACLRFFAAGTYQVGAGNDFNVGIAQPTFSKILKEILDIFCTHLCPKLIKFPEDQQEKDKTKSFFYRKFVNSYSPEKSKQIVNVCCALNNLCIKLNVPDYEEDLQDLEDEEESLSIPEINESSGNSLGTRIRDELMNAMV